MPGMADNGVADEREENERNINPSSSNSKEASIPIESQKPESSGVGGGAVDTSIDQLYENVYDMQSSDRSLSRRSFGSDGDESRIDSELHHLVGGQMREVEIMEEEMQEKQGGGDGIGETSSKKMNPSNDRKVNNVDEIQHASTSSVTSEKPKKPSNAKLQSKTTTLKSKPIVKIPPVKPSLEKKTDNKPLKKPITGGGVSSKKSTIAPPGRSVSQIRAKNTVETASDKPEMGPILLKQAADQMSSGDNPQKALELALQATRVFENYAGEKPSLELVMSLHVAAAIYCSLGQYNDAIPVLLRSISIPVIEEGEDHALGKFAGLMQLGDTYAMLGQLENAITYYTKGLLVQKQILGEADQRVGETCRYLAEAHVQALQFDEAERLCKMALDIHRARHSPPTLEEAADRRLMGLICETKGKHEAALEHLVLASMAMVANGQDGEVASVDCSIGDTYLSLSRYDEAAFAYQKALSAFKASKGENHPTVALVFVRLADLYKKTGKIKESKSYCENALKIYEKPLPGVLLEDIASGLTDVAAIYESMNEHEQALNLLKKALNIYNNAPGQQNTIAGIEAQLGVLYYIAGDFTESYNAFKNAITKLRAMGEKRSAFFGVALNQMGLSCVQRYALSEAAELFEEARSVLEQEYGPYHPETLGIYSNLAGTYDALGRLDDAIEILEYVVSLREERLGTANPDVYDEKRRLSELLKEAGRVRSRRSISLERLLDSNIYALNNFVMRMAR